MMDQTTPEQSIYLKPLLQTFIRQWKALLISMLVGAVLLGSYQALAPLKVPALDTEAVAALEAQIEECQQSIDNNTQRKEDNLAAIKEKQNTILELREDLEDERAYLHLCQDSLRQVTELLEDAAGDTKVSLLAQFTALNDDIRKAQNTMEQIENSITASQDEIKRIRKENRETIPETGAALRENLADLLSQKEALEAASDPSLAVRSPKKILLFTVIGLVLGACVRAVWIFVQAASSHKLQDPDEIVSNYGVPLLASLKNAADVEDACRLAAAKLQVQLTQGQEILVTGTLPVPELQAVCEQLQKYAASYTLRVVGNGALDADATLALQKANVVVVESRGVSDFRQIVAMMQALSLCGARCLGLIEK